MRKRIARFFGLMLIEDYIFILKRMKEIQSDIREIYTNEIKVQGALNDHRIKN